MLSSIAYHQICFERLLAQSVAVTLFTIKDKALSSATDKLIDLLHDETVNLSVLKQMLKCSGNGRCISQ